MTEVVDGQGAAELAFGLNVAYREFQTVAPVGTLSGLALESMPENPPHRLFKWWRFAHQSDECSPLLRHPVATLPSRQIPS